jgi:hypothetical protein
MQSPTPPHAVGVEIAATKPTEADRAAIAHLSATSGAALEPVAFLVMVGLDPIPPATSLGWALYVGDFRVPKYWQYRDGIYFKIFDPRFFDEHAGEALRFSQNGTDFVDTGLVLQPSAVRRQLSASEMSDLPEQAAVLESDGEFFGR